MRMTADDVLRAEAATLGITPTGMPLPYRRLLAATQVTVHGREGIVERHHLQAESYRVAFEDGGREWCAEEDVKPVQIGGDTAGRIVVP